MRVGTVWTVYFSMLYGLGTRKASSGIDLEMIQDLVRCQRPRVIHAGANNCVGRHGVGWA